MQEPSLTNKRRVHHIALTRVRREYASLECSGLLVPPILVAAVERNVQQYKGTELIF